jgi:LPS export ABC transporter protein LptC
MPMSWQQPARVGIALAGGACAAFVLLTLGTREAPPPPDAPARMDPSAVIETSGASLRQLSPLPAEPGAGGRPGRREYALEAARHLTYEDGTTRFIGGVRASVDDDEGPDFTITAEEAVAGGDGDEVEFSGGVEVRVPAGFALEAPRMVLGTTTGLLRTDGPTTFAREGLRGTGPGLTYDTGADTLQIEGDASGALTADGGARIEFAAATLTFDRGRRLLHLAGAVDILRAGDRLSAERVDVELDEQVSRATFISLRGQAGMRAPAGALETMAADAIDLSYSADGARLERVGLLGNAVLDLAAEGEAAAGRRVRGGGMQITLDEGQGLARLEATGGVALTLPRAGGPGFVVTAEGVDARGEGGALRTAGLVGGVVFEEAGTPGQDRRVTAERLVLELDAGTVSLAIFTGGSRLVAGEVEATGPEIHYRPGNASLSLRGTAGALPSRLTSGALVVESGAIDAMLDPLWVAADGGVQTTLAAPRADSSTRLPGLLDEGAAVNVSATAFEYDGADGPIAYTGTAVLWQGETTIRGDALVLDQASGDFTVTGAAQSTLRLDGEVSVGAAQTLRYTDASRQVVYAGPDRPEAAPADGGARLSGPQGDLTAGRIAVQLDEDGGVAALDAEAGVQLLLDTRTATGRALTHETATGAYVLEGALGRPATLTDGCRRTEGQTLTFMSTGDRVVVDGNEALRTRTAGMGCTEPLAP